MMYNILTISGHTIDGQQTVGVVLAGLTEGDLEKISLKNTENGTHILCRKKAGFSPNRNLTKRDLMVVKTLA